MTDYKELIERLRRKANLTEHVHVAREFRAAADAIEELMNATTHESCTDCPNKLPCGWCRTFDAPCSFLKETTMTKNAISSLPSAQPEQTNCEYCHTDSDGYVFPLDKNSHAFVDRDKIVLKANGWRGEAKIKYCPICGRRLTDE